MTGCLLAPFRLIGCLGLLALLVLGWLFRDRLIGEGRRLLGGSPAPVASPVAAGRPGSRALSVARAKIDSLNGWRADSVVLTPSEVASLLGSGLEPSFRRELDSLQVELLENEVLVRARLRTSRIPRDVLGPLAGKLGASEPIQAAGPLRVTGPGTGEWVVRSVRIHDLPLPPPLVPTLVSRALGDPGRETVPWAVPPGVRDVRIHPGRATLYGAPRP